MTAPLHLYVKAIITARMEKTICHFAKWNLNHIFSNGALQPAELLLLPCTYEDYLLSLVKLLRVLSPFSHEDQYLSSFLCLSKDQPLQSFNHLLIQAENGRGQFIGESTKYWYLRTKVHLPDRGDRLEVSSSPNLIGRKEGSVRGATSKNLSFIPDYLTELEILLQKSDMIGVFSYNADNIWDRPIRFGHY